jgi:hypothetical protein
MVKKRQLFFTIECGRSRHLKFLYLGTLKIPMRSTTDLQRFHQIWSGLIKRERNWQQYIEVPDGGSRSFEVC